MMHYLVYVLFWILLAPDNFDHLKTYNGEVSFSDLGVFGSGGDETGSILKAINIAKSRRLMIRLETGRKYIFSPTQTVDLTGMKGFTGSGTFDVSKTGKAVGNNSMVVVFQVSGSKVFSESITGKIFSGKNEIEVIDPGHYRISDQFFLVSTEKIPKANRPYYFKGQRLIVKGVDSVNKKVSFKDTFHFTIGSACLYRLVSEPEFFVGKNVRFETSFMNFITCFRFQLANVHISGTYINFGIASIMLKSSRGIINQANINTPVSENNGYSHGIQVNDMSDVLISNCKISGGRHCVSGGGGGLWKASECNGSNGNAGYPSVYVIDGGNYSGGFANHGIGPDVPALDAHGNVYSMTVKNCVVNGGINLGSNFARVENVQIETSDKFAIIIGNDQQAGKGWGHVYLKNIQIRSTNKNKIPIGIAKSSIELLSMNNVTVEGNNIPETIVDFKNNIPFDLVDDKFIIKGHFQRKFSGRPSKKWLAIDVIHFQQ